MRKITATALLVAIACAGASAGQDEFTGLKCGDDVRARLVGRKIRNQPVARTEALHKELGLKDLGGDMGEDESTSFVAWRICGDTYAFLLVKSTIKDIYRFAPSSAQAPRFMGGTCVLGGKPVPGYLVGTLDAGSDDSLLPVKEARRVEGKSGTFAPFEFDKLRCARDGIVKDED